ncbi:Membrane associated serine protease, rhomboid family [Marinitoga hydrogenitolerans DSM 16785]|uniref:Membrane associated serine protease, rhomboid family n=1 Tax=Marinitoga hydrogenitolerans (strain DSM 16785 / JCM 12826 / AT1271) TaxID=1122195 RepID=A0A1M4W444_MARH1|nr:rhomboid family intramembrane serine protease [Marinitoga hydrogenitolerans]SHE76008.1 Membrane associated serine protease, rhomboid family [Marinitoga hydrogenitolerans DSM 16785]
MFPLRDINPSSKKPIVTIILIVINTIIFIFEIILPPEIREMFINNFGFTPVELTKGIVYGDLRYIILNFFTILTSMFLHGSFMHIIGNMWSLWLFGDNVEDKLGHFKFLLVYIISGYIASFTHYIFNINSPVVAIGASGAIAGVIGIYFVLFPFAKIQTLFLLLWFPFFVNIPAFIFIGLWFLTQVFNGLLSLVGPYYGSGVAWWAHIGGFIYGTYLAEKYKREFYYY